MATGLLRPVEKPKPAEAVAAAAGAGAGAGAGARKVAAAAAASSSPSPTPESSARPRASASAEMATGLLRPVEKPKPAEAAAAAAGAGAGAGPMGAAAPAGAAEPAGATSSPLSTDASSARPRASAASVSATGLPLPVAKPNAGAGAAGAGGGGGGGGGGGSSSSTSSSPRALRPTWSVVKGERNGLTYCAPYVHLAAYAAAGNWVRANLLSDARAGASSSAAADEEGEEEDEDEDEDEGVAAAAAYESVGLFGLRDRSHAAVSEVRSFVARVAAHLGVAAVAAPPPSGRMQRADAESLVARLLAVSCSRPFGFATPALLRAALVPLLMNDGPVRLWLLERTNQTVAKRAEMRATGAGAPPFDIGFGGGRFQSSTYAAASVFSLVARRDGYQPKLNRGAAIFVDVDLRLLLESWAQRRFLGAYSPYAAGNTQIFYVAISINAADPYFWLVGQTTNASGVFCAPLLLNAIANGSGPSGTKVECLRLTWQLDWEHENAAKSRGGEQRGAQRGAPGPGRGRGAQPKEPGTPGLARATLARPRQARPGGALGLSRGAGPGRGCGARGGGRRAARAHLLAITSPALTTSSRPHPLSRPRKSMVLRLLSVTLLLLHLRRARATGKIGGPASMAQQAISAAAAAGAPPPSSEAAAISVGASAMGEQHV